MGAIEPHTLVCGGDQTTHTCMPNSPQHGSQRHQILAPWEPNLCEGSSEGCIGVQLIVWYHHHQAQSHEGVCGQQQQQYQHKQHVSTRTTATLTADSLVVPKVKPKVKPSLVVSKVKQVKPTFLKLNLLPAAPYRAQVAGL